MPRTSGCPETITNVLIEVQNPASQKWVRVRGFNSYSFDISMDTEEGSDGDTAWKEPFASKKGFSGTFDGKPIFDKVTGAYDPGQEILNNAILEQSGCEGDLPVRITDSVGHAVQFDALITGKSKGADESGSTISYNYEGVGEPEELPYVQVTGVQVMQGGTALDDTTNKLTVAVNETADVQVVFAPDNASNQKYAIYPADSTIVKVVAIEDNNVVLQGVKVGETTVTLRTQNGNKTATFGVTVTE